MNSLNTTDTALISEGFKDYFNDMMLLCNEINLAYSELKNKSNKLRLIVSEEVESIIKELLENLNQNKDISNKLLQHVSTLDGMIDVQTQHEMSNQLLEIDKTNQELRSQLIKQMRIELHEI